MMKDKFHILIAVLVLSFAFPIFIQAEEIPSIADLLEEARPGDVIELERHLYEEDVVIDKPVTIIGVEGTTIEGTGVGDVITLKADGITLKNVRITGSGTVLDHDHAGVKILSDDNTVKGTTIEESLHGIYVEEGKGNDLVGNTIVGNKNLNSSRRGNGIHLFHSSHSAIAENTITHARDGIYFSFAEHTVIEKNKVSHTRYGLHYMYSDFNEFYQNDFFENIGGAAIMYSDHIRLEENRFYDHHDLQSFGVLFQTANDVEMINNDIHFNQTGIFMDQSNRNTIIGNRVTNNRIGLDVWSSSMNNLFTENQFLNNRLQFTSNGGEDQNYWNDGEVGNAWSDYVFIDFNEDGVSDDAYQYASAFGEVLAEEQLGMLFLDSPALSLYENWNNILNPDEVKIEDDQPIQVTKRSGGMQYVVIPAVNMLLLLVILRRKRKGA